jgi:hypothetical protein
MGKKAGGDWGANGSQGEALVTVQPCIKNQLMSTTSNGVAKKTEKRIFLLMPGKECNASEKNLPLNCAMIICRVPRGSKTRSVLSYQWINTACKFATGTPLHCLSKKIYIYHIF